jgi:hypothetical protein
LFSAREKGFGFAAGSLPLASAGEAGARGDAGFGDVVVVAGGSDFPTARGSRGAAAALAGSAFCAAASCCLRRFISASFAATAARSFSMSASVAACFALSPETAAAFSGGETVAATRGFGMASRFGDLGGDLALFPVCRGTISARYVEARFASTMGDRRMGNSSAGSMNPASRIMSTLPRAESASGLGAALCFPRLRVCTVKPWCTASASASSALVCSRRATSARGMACFPYVAFTTSSARERTLEKYL